MSKTATKVLQQQVMAEAMELQSLKPISVEELKKHNTPTDAWVMIDSIVYDVTKFVKLHPGGAAVLLRSAGTDATKDFRMVHHHTVLTKYANLRVGRLALEELEPAAVKRIMKEKATEKWLPLTMPYFADIRGTLKSPHIKPHHLKFAAKVRAFVEKEMKPFVAQWDAAGKFPRDLHQRAYKAGVYSVGAPAEYGGIEVEDGFDYFISFLHAYEMTRCGSGGVLTGLIGALGIATPPILNHGSEEMKKTIGRDIVKGEKLACLGITEPWGGSDVASLRTFAVKDGDYYIISGEKKFISGGTVADYCTTAVRTDPTKKGMEGISLILIPLATQGVERELIKTQGYWGSYTTYIIFDKVRVHKSMLLGKENEGFRYIMENFNNERFGMLAQCCGAIHEMIEECIRYARNRHTFGQPLIKSQVIRHKIANMAMRSETLFAYAEQIAYHLTIGVPAVDLGARVALGKAYATSTLEYVAREASQIFGGNSYMRNGPGATVERFYRDVRAVAISGGSEEIMLDLAMRGSKL